MKSPHGSRIREERMTRCNFKAKGDSSKPKENVDKGKAVGN